MTKHMGAQSTEDALTAAEERMRALEDAEQAVNAAFQTGKAARAEITKSAQEEAEKAVQMVGDAMEADERADEAGRLAVIAENMGDHQKTKNARKKARDARREAKSAHKAATKVAKGAYDAIKFSQPGKLGFMRFVQVMYAISIAGTLLALIMTSRDTIVYDSVTIMDWVFVILEGVGFWLFINYFKVAKQFVIVTSALSILASIIIAIIGGNISVYTLIANNLWNVFLIFYFLFSKRVDLVLVNDFSTFRPQQHAELQIKRRGWPFVRNLIIYFIVFSVLGHWMEAGLCQFIRLGWVQGEYDPTNTMLWRDWLYPYPMEGAAVVIIALVLYPLWRFLLRKFEDKQIIAYVLSFLANALTCSIIEFSMGLLVNGNYQLWDYRENFGNIMGQVCLQNALAFGVAASLIAWVVYPMLERWLSRVPNDTMNIAFVVIAVIGGILWSLYIIDPPEDHASEGGDAQQSEVKGLDTFSVDAFDTLLDIGTLQVDLDNTQGISDESRAKLQEKIDELHSDLTDLTDELDKAA